MFINTLPILTLNSTTQHFRKKNMTSNSGSCYVSSTWRQSWHQSDVSHSGNYKRPNKTEPLIAPDFFYLKCNISWWLCSWVCTIFYFYVKSIALIACVLSVVQKMVCHGEHTYLFAQAMMSILAQEEQGGSVVRRIGQEVQKFALQRWCKILINDWAILTI